MDNNDIKLKSNGYFQSLNEVVKEYLKINELKNKYLKLHKKIAQQSYCNTETYYWTLYQIQKKQLKQLKETYFI